MHLSKIGLKTKPKANTERPGTHCHWLYYMDGEILCMLTHTQQQQQQQLRRRSLIPGVKKEEVADNMTSTDRSHSVSTAI